MPVKAWRQKGKSMSVVAELDVSLPTARAQGAAAHLTTYSTSQFSLIQIDVRTTGQEPQIAAYRR